MPTRNPDILGRFWSKVDVRSEGECWEWKSPVDYYGRFNILPGLRSIGTHRFSWILANRRDIPDGLFVLHSCDNKRCVNPAHLSLGTCSENARQAVERGLVVPPTRPRPTECRKGHPLTPDNTYTYGDHRRCKPCHNERQRKYADKDNERRRMRRAQERAT